MLSQFCFCLELFATFNALKFISGKEIEFQLILLHTTVILTTRSIRMVKFAITSST